VSFRAAATAALLALLLPAGPAGAEKKKEKDREILLETSADDQRAGEEAYEEVIGQLGLVEDPELTAYVQRIGDRLVRHAPRRGFDYRFQIVDQSAPNAFALPGGFIFVSRGLLVLANSEDELANVLAHEIVHVAARHAAARQDVIEGLPGPFAFFALGHIFQYTRDQEREADRLGQGLSALAGYDPGAMARFLRDLEFLERMKLGASRLPGFFDTHPVTAERTAAAATRAQIARYTPQPGIARDRDAYLRRIEGLAVGTSAREGVFRGDVFLHADLDFAMRFPHGWDLKNTHTAVGAISPRRDGQVFLELHGKGRDPVQAAVEFLAESTEDGLRIDVDTSEGLTVAELPAYRVTGTLFSPRAGRVQVTLTFIARDGKIYRLTGATRGGSDRYRGVYRNVARSFRPLTAEERASIRETRLRLVEVGSGETLAELARRAGNEWNPNETAIMNDLFGADGLESGRLVKVAVSEAYRPEGSPDPGALSDSSR